MQHEYYGFLNTHSVTDRFHKSCLSVVNFLLYSKRVLVYAILYYFSLKNRKQIKHTKDHTYSKAMETY